MGGEVPEERTKPETITYKGSPVSTLFFCIIFPSRRGNKFVRRIIFCHNDSILKITTCETKLLNNPLRKSAFYFGTFICCGCRTSAAACSSVLRGCDNTTVGVMESINQVECKRTDIGCQESCSSKKLLT